MFRLGPKRNLFADESLNAIAALQAVNSIEFARNSLALLNAGQPSAVFRTLEERKRLSGLGVKDFRNCEASKGWASLKYEARRRDDFAQIALTSGTTGAPKAIALSSRNIADTVERLNDVMQTSSDIREYVAIPVTYSFGMGRVRAVSAVGGSFYIPENGFSPLEIARMLEAGEINALSAVPTLLRVLLENQNLFSAGRSSMRWIEIGSQPMDAGAKEQLRNLFPNASIIQHYGLTEASRTTFLRVHEASNEALDSVGAPTGQVEISIDTMGRVSIRGAHVARFELTEGGERALTNDEGWLVTNDLGEIKDGNLHLQGRIDDLINIGGVKLNPEALERDIARKVGLAPANFAVSKVPDPVRGDGIAVAIEANVKNPKLDLYRAAIDAAAAYGVNAASSIAIMQVDALPRTETGKIRRQEIAKQFVAQNLTFEAANQNRPVEPQAIRGRQKPKNENENSIANSGDASTLERELVSIWQAALGRDDISLDLSFYDIGGDSLSAVTVALNLEKAGISPKISQGIFEGKTIRELTKQFQLDTGTDFVIEPTPEKSQIAWFSQASNFIKGVALLCMIGSHWIPPYLDRFSLKRSALNDGLAVFFSLGTPTIAFIFGVGLTVYQLRQRRKNKSAFGRNYRLSLALLALGVLLNGAIELVGFILMKKSMADGAFGDVLFSPFVYFFVATASLPLWLGALKINKKSIITVLIASGVLFSLYSVFAAYLGVYSRSHGLMELLLIGRWNVFQMAGISLFGVATGLSFQLLFEKQKSLAPMAAIGAILVAVAIGASAMTGALSIWTEFPKQVSLMTIAFYSGVAIVILASFRELAGFCRRTKISRIALEIVCSVGVLLFPLFVLQSFVYRSATIASKMTGASFLVCLTALIVVFAIGAGLMIRRVHRLYYARHS